MNKLIDEKCVVLGGGGFIGTNLCAALVGEVTSVRGFDRIDRPGVLSDAIEWCQGGFDDAAIVSKAIRGCDVVFHLIGTTTPESANRDVAADVESNVVNTVRLLDACVAEKVSRVIFISSGGTVYGVPDQIPTPETAETLPIGAYGLSKLTIEKYLQLYERMYSLESRILRLANPFGEHQLARNNQGELRPDRCRAAA